MISQFDIGKVLERSNKKQNSFFSKIPPQNRKKMTSPIPPPQLLVADSFCIDNNGQIIRFQDHWNRFLSGISRINPEIDYKNDSLSQLASIKSQLQQQNMESGFPRLEYWSNGEIKLLKRPIPTPLRT